MRKESDSQLLAARMEAENAALLLQVVDRILGRIDLSTTLESDPQHPVRIACTHVRLALAYLTDALTGEDTPSSLFGYLARIFSEQSKMCKQYEDKLDQKSNGNSGPVN